MKKILVLFVFLFSLGATAQFKVSDSLSEPLPFNIKLDYPRDFGVDFEQLKIDGILLTRKLVSLDYLKTLSFTEQLEMRENSRYLKVIDVKDFERNGQLYTGFTYIKYDAFNGKPLPFEVIKKVIKYPTDG